MRIEETKPQENVGLPEQVKLIEVTFPAAGGVGVPAKAEVKCGQPVTWHFQSWNSQVKEMEVEFQDPARHHFFPKEPRHRCKVGISDGNIHGQGPMYPGATWPVHAKYTVRGLDHGGEPVAVVDPEIITPKP